MLLHQKLIHPDINGIIGAAGHHSKILIADGNYPASSTLGPNAELVSLNLMPGVVTCSQVLEALLRWQLLRLSGKEAKVPDCNLRQGVRVLKGPLLL